MSGVLNKTAAAAAIATALSVDANEKSLASESLFNLMASLPVRFEID